MNCQYHPLPSSIVSQLSPSKLMEKPFFQVSHLHIFKFFGLCLSITSPIKSKATTLDTIPCLQYTDKY